MPPDRVADAPMAHGGAPALRHERVEARRSGQRSTRDSSAALMGRKPEWRIAGEPAHRPGSSVEGLLKIANMACPAWSDASRPRFRSFAFIAG
jgi:hypothetical protein